jgi:hypothetical protein
MPTSMQTKKFWANDRLTRQRRRLPKPNRALELLAASRDGCTEAISLTRCLLEKEKELLAS